MSTLQVRLVNPSLRQDLKMTHHWCQRYSDRVDLLGTSRDVLGFSLGWRSPTSPFLPSSRSFAPVVRPASHTSRELPGGPPDPGAAKSTEKQNILGWIDPDSGNQWRRRTTQPRFQDIPRLAAVRRVQNILKNWRLRSRLTFRHAMAFNARRPTPRHSLRRGLSGAWNLSLAQDRDRRLGRITLST